MLQGRLLGIGRIEERIKAEMAAVERQCELIVARFDDLDRPPTIAEREARRADFIANRKRLGQLDTQLMELKFRSVGC